MHEVRVDFETCKNSDINAVDFSNSNDKSRLPTKDEVHALSRKLCESEPVYLNTNVISRTQVLDLLNKLYENKYRCLPQSPKNDLKEGAESALEEDSQEEDPHKKSDLFDTSKDRIGEQRNKQFAQQSDEDDLDLGFNSSKKEKNEGGANRSLNDNAAFEAELAAGMSDDDGPMTEEQQKAIEEQFQRIYETDAELRKALEKSDVSNFTVLEKYQIIEAYMQGGAAGLQIELEDEEDDEKIVQEMSEEEIEQVETQFAKLYAADADLQSALGQIENLTLLQKYQILV